MLGLFNRSEVQRRFFAPAWRIVLAPLLAAGVALTLGTFAFAQQTNADLSGTWQLAGSFKSAMKTADGKAPPLKPDARELHRKRIDDRKAGKTEDGVDACLPPGTPRIMWMKEPLMILQTPQKITLLHEYQHTLRHIYLDGKLPPADEVELSYGGTSAGHWEGDTLVIETIGFNGLTQLDRDGLPHSPDMKVTERLRLVDKGKTLENLVTIDDPATYTAPWTARVTYKRAPKAELKEDICALKLLDPALRKPGS
jgi:hypothetical protein